jgi:hypothetical protein
MRGPAPIGEKPQPQVPCRNRAALFSSAADLANALRRAALAPCEHKKLIGKVDPTWATWCADYFVREQTDEPHSRDRISRALTDTSFESLVAGVVCGPAVHQKTHENVVGFIDELVAGAGFEPATFGL